MKNNKAADMEGLTAEHFKYGGDSILVTVTDTVNDVMNSGKIPKVKDSLPLFTKSTEKQHLIQIPIDESQ